MNSTPQKLNKPVNLTPKSKKQEMRDYPDSYYQEIVKFTQDSRNWLL